MERQRIFIALAACAGLWFSAAESAFAQGAPPPPRGPNGGGHFGRTNRAFGPARQRWREMSPEDRMRFRSNAERWLRMNPEQQRMLRDQENLRRQRIAREAEAALQQSGVQLEAEKREQYERRYLQERRRIERGLRQELEEKRQRELAPVVEGLIKEFSDIPKGLNPSPSAASSSAPGKER